MSCHCWPEPLAEADAIGNGSWTKAHEHERDQQRHPAVGGGPEEEGRNNVAEQGRNEDDSEIERDVISQGEANVLKRRDRGSRKLQIRAGGGTEHLELCDSPGKA